MQNVKAKEGGIKQHYAELGAWVKEAQLPIVYSRASNISFFGLETWNRFDAWKLEKIFQSLVKAELLKEGEQPSPSGAISQEILEVVHSVEYLTKLHQSKWEVMRLTELPGLSLLPNFLVQRQIIAPLKVQVAGTVLALGIALERGWCVHLGGGMIHAGRDHGAGWCPYDDLSCAMLYARARLPTVRQFMIIDFGAHQGNGYQRNKLLRKDDAVFVVDVFNEMIFPQDEEAAEAINVERRLGCGTGSDVYMAAISSALTEATQFDPDAILYVAGTNVLEEDYSGQLRVKREDLWTRDRLVFQFAKSKKAPICMVTSSGYSKTNSEVVAESLKRLVADGTLVV